MIRLFHRFRRRLHSGLCRLFLSVGLFLMGGASALAAGYKYGNSSATCGGVNYAQGAGALKDAFHYVVTTMTVVMGLCCAIAAVLSIVSALQVYLKINDGDTTFKKDLVLLVGAVLFLLSAMLITPAFYNFEYLGTI